MAKTPNRKSPSNWKTFQCAPMPCRRDCLTWRAEDKARAGAVVSIGYNGSIEIERGLIRPEDRHEMPSAAGGDRGETPPSPARSALPDRLVEDLTAHRTAALRAMLADNPFRGARRRCSCDGVAGVRRQPLRHRKLSRFSC
jgi:hypothetical protein